MKIKQTLTLAFISSLPMLVLGQQDTNLHNTSFGNMRKVADTIVKNTGERLIVTLTEVNPANVRYKQFDYENGPTFTLPKSDISYLIYANGSRESFENYVKLAAQNGGGDLSIQASGWGYYYKHNYITEPDMLDLASKLKDKNLDKLIDETEKRRVWHTVTLLGGIFLIGDGLYVISTNRTVRYHTGGLVTGNTPASQAQNRTIGRCIFLGGLATEGVTVYLRYNRRKYAHLVMDAYNKDKL